MASASGLAAPASPFILTLELDDASFVRLNGWRRRFFPAERNVIAAHLTIFHQLPGDRSREIKAYLRSVVAAQAEIAVESTEWKALDRGVALFLRSPRLAALRDALAAEWRPWLIAQDLAGFRPHVTVQNKVSQAEARRTLAEINAVESRELKVRGIGLHLWRYLGGPWEDAGLFRFR